MHACMHACMYIYMYDTCIILAVVGLLLTRLLPLKLQQNHQLKTRTPQRIQEYTLHHNIKAPII